jgi:hypothetical protein
MKKTVMILSILVLFIGGIIIFIMMPRNIKFENWGGGFVPLSGINDTRTLPPKTLLITSDVEWRDYADKYIIKVIPVYSEVIKDKILLLVNLPSAMDYEQASSRKGYTIESIKRRFNELIIYVKSNEEPELKFSSEAKSLVYGMFMIDKDTVNSETIVKIKMMD